MNTNDLPWIVPLFIAGVVGLLRYIHVENKADRLAEKVEELKEENARLRERADNTK